LNKIKQAVLKITAQIYIPIFTGKEKRD